MHSTFKIILGVALLLSPVLSSAQQEPIREIEFQTFSWKPFPTKVFYYSGADRIDQKIARRGLSPISRYRGPSPLVFYKEGTDADGQPIDVPVASVNLTASKSREILMFSEQAGNITVHRFQDPAIFKGANVSIFNLSDRTLAMQIGQARFTVAPKSKRITDLSPQITAQEGVNFPQLTASVASSNDAGEWDMIYRKHWPIDERSSMLAFAVNQDDRVRIYLIRNLEVD